jgi:hypothetical protein
MHLPYDYYSGSYAHVSLKVVLRKVNKRAKVCEFHDIPNLKRHEQSGFHCNCISLDENDLLQSVTKTSEHGYSIETIVLSHELSTLMNLCTKAVSIEY